MLPIICLSGTLCSNKLWEEMLGHLKYPYEVKIMNFHEQNSIQSMAQKVIDETHGNFIVAGLSLGGIVALEVVNLAPERVKQLILFNTNPFLPTVEQIESWERYKFFIQTQGFESFIMECWVPALVDQHQPNCTTLSRVVQEMAKDIGKEAYLKQLEAVQHRQDQTLILPSIQCRTLILVGENDKICPVDLSRYMYEHIVNSSLEIIPCTGHLSTLEQPQKVANIVSKWLAISIE